MLWPVLMALLYTVLVLCTLAILGAAAAGYVRVRRQLRVETSDTMLMQALHDIEEEQKSSPV